MRVNKKLKLEGIEVEIEIKIKKVLAEAFNQTFEEGMPDLSLLLKDIGVNSLSYVKIIVALESAFDIEFEDSDLNYEQNMTVNDVVNLTKKYL